MSGNPHRCKHPNCNVFASKDGYCRVHRPMVLGRTHYKNRTEYLGYGFHKGKFIPDDYGYIKDKYGYED